MKVLTLIFVALSSLPTLLHAAAKQTAKNKIDFLFYSAPNPINWKTPTTLVRTTIKNYLAIVDPKALESLMQFSPETENSSKSAQETDMDRQFSQVFALLENEKRGGGAGIVTYPHGISHVNVRLQCEGSEEILLGMTGEEPNSYYLRKLLFEGGSMETIAENTRGRFFTKDEVNQWLPYMKSSGMMHQLSYLISNQNCNQIQKYLVAYKDFKQNLIYGGLGTEPLSGVGAGCSAFAMSVMKVAGLYEQTFEHHFTRSLRISNKMFNFPGNKAEVDVYDILWDNDLTWASENEPHQIIHFWDPQLMYDWTKAVGMGTLKWYQNYKVTKDQNSITIEVNAEKIPTPKTFVHKPQHIEKIKAEVNRLWN
ncbi:MAG: hypothetical protein ACK5WZ_07540 [Pseudobdellovibrionaceae bacterium]